ncbi:hypothetical protein SO802_020370 [Lithocarpus litseifolius]|uniref:Uncharacterized protein n=1 Tax=Lithocarpus litseifolius TaxID=425828 RepID=A0AAW2CEK7_9ROSI
MKKLTWSPKRESSAHSLVEEEEEEYEVDNEGREEEGDEEKKDEEEKEEGDDDEEGQVEGDKTVAKVDGGVYRPFFLPSIWMVNDFYLTMSSKVFNTLCNRFQIPEHIPIRLPRMFERCHSCRTADVGMYDMMFTVVIRPEEWDSMPDGFDNNWGILNESVFNSSLSREKQRTRELPWACLGDFTQAEEVEGLGYPRHSPWALRWSRANA